MQSEKIIVSSFNIKLILTEAEAEAFLRDTVDIQHRMIINSLRKELKSHLTPEKDEADSTDSGIKLTFDYINIKGEMSHRHITLQSVYIKNNYYCYFSGYDSDREDIRTFKYLRSSNMKLNNIYVLNVKDLLKSIILINPKILSKDCLKFL